MLPVAPVAFPLTCPPVRPRGVGALCVDADEANTLTRLETELELQVGRKLPDARAFHDRPSSAYLPCPLVFLR